jgi:protocatechuate 3,4-dioxygenase beta subunit
VASPTVAEALLRDAEPTARMPAAADIATATPDALTGAIEPDSPPRAPAGTWHTRMTVLDEQGQPAAGATIELWRERSTADGRSCATTEERVTGRADESGAFVFDGPWRKISAIAWANGATSEPFESDVYRSEFVLALRAAGSVAGSVRDAVTGQPIEGAVVSLWTHARHDVVSTDAAGRFLHPRLPLLGLRQQVRVQAPGYAASLALVESDAQAGTRTWASGSGEPRIQGLHATAWLDFDLHPEALVRGRVYDTRRQPVIGARIRAEGYALLTTGAATPDLAEAISDEHGDYELRGLRPDIAHAVRAEAAELAAVLIELPAGPLHELEVVLEPGATIQGTLLDAAGLPAEGVQVDLVLCTPPLIAPGGTASVKVRRLGRCRSLSTDAAGSFACAGLAAQRYRLRVRRAGTELLVREFEPRPGEAIELPPLVLAAATLTMHGTLAALDRSVEGCPIEIWRGRWLGTVHADAGGRFRIAGLDADMPYELRWCDRDAPDRVLATAQAWAFETPHLVATREAR